MIAHYISEMVNMIGYLIILNESFSSMETARKIEFNIIVVNYKLLSLLHKSKNKIIVLFYCK